MWQKEKKDSSTISFSLLLALILTPVTTLFVSGFARAQSSPKASSSPRPETVSGLKVRIDGSDRMLAINQTLKRGFENQFSGTEVEVAASGSETALKALQDGSIDIAAIGRGLKPDEKAQGLELVRLRREKIAIVVGKDNPFKGSLTIKQFARIVRGRMTNWSRLGRTKGKIRFIDRPESSEMWQAIRGYSVFKSRNFTKSSNAIQIAEENTSELVKQLGKDGISYVKADRVSQLQGVRVVPIHGTLPKDPKYPFSLPLVYVYKKNPSSPASRFLAFAKTPQGKQSVENARDSETVTVAQSLAGTVIKNTSLSNRTSVTTNPTISPSAEATLTPPSTNTVIPTKTSGELVSPSHRAFAPPPDRRENTQEIASLFWLMVPLSLGGLILWRFYKRRSHKDEDFQTAAILSPNSSPEQGNNGTASQLRENTANPKSRNGKVSHNTPFTLLSKLTGNLASVNGGAALAGGAIATGTQLQSRELDTVNGVVQPQVKQGKALYPPLPDIWDEVAADDRELLTQGTTSSTSVQPQKSQEITTDVQPSTEIVNDSDANISDSIKPKTATTNNELPDYDKALDLDWEAPVAVVTPVYPKFPDIAAMGSGLPQEGTTEPDLCPELLDDSVSSDQ